jgi:hypothetical protein
VRHVIRGERIDLIDCFCSNSGQLSDPPRNAPNNNEYRGPCYGLYVGAYPLEGAIWDYHQDDLSGRGKTRVSHAALLRNSSFLN